MNIEDVLLTEYKTCQSEVNNRGNYFWVSLNITISINLILLTQSAYDVITNSLSKNGLVNAVGVSTLAILMMYINWSFVMWQKRQHYVTAVIYQRMRKIEDATGMHSSWLIHGLDLTNDSSKRTEWKGLADSRRKFIEKLIASYPYLPKYTRPRGDKIFGRVLSILITLWVTLAFLAILIYFCPAVKSWIS